MPEQSINIDFPWPTPSGLKGKPVWNGRGFHVDGRSFPVLSFEVGAAGWTDDLTTFHEHTAGDSHFIDMASRRHAVSQVTSHASQGLPVILDIGCSSGFLLEDLRTAFPDALIMGADVVLRRQGLSRRRP